MAGVKRKAVKKIPVNPLDAKIIKAIMKGANRSAKINQAMPKFTSEREVDRRLQALKREGKLGYLPAPGWHIPLTANASNDTVPIPNRGVVNPQPFEGDSTAVSE